ncbi:MAG TPA: hypothetical protein VF174_06065 [Micromonosporaceae bacterium]
MTTSVPRIAPRSCNVLRAVDGADLVVTFDFAAAGRPTATFTELVERLTTRCNVWETAPPRYGEEADMGGADYVDRWAADIRASGLPVRALIGFCTGSLYAAALFERICDWQPQPPRLILLDPELSSRQPLFDHYERMIGRLSAVLTPQETEAALARGRAALAAPGDSLSVAKAIGALCHQVVAPGLLRSGFSSTRAAEFVGLFTAYLHWFAAAAELDKVGIWSVATAVNSSTPGSGLATFPEAERARLVADAIYLDVPHREFMRSTEVARVVDELLS